MLAEIHLRGLDLDTHKCSHLIVQVLEIECGPNCAVMGDHFLPSSQNINTQLETSL